MSFSPYRPWPWVWWQSTTIIFLLPWWVRRHFCFYLDKMQLYTTLSVFRTALSTPKCVWLFSFHGASCSACCKAKIHPSLWVSESCFSSLRIKLNVTQPGAIQRKETCYYFPFVWSILNLNSNLIEIDGLEKLTHCHLVDYKYTLCILSISCESLTSAYFLNSAPTFSPRVAVHNPERRKQKPLDIFLFRLALRLKFSKILWSSHYKDCSPRCRWTAARLRRAQRTEDWELR